MALGLLLEVRRYGGRVNHPSGSKDSDFGLVPFKSPLASIGSLDCLVSLKQLLGFYYRRCMRNYHTV